ncbi:MAG TPA: hypothetical protein VNY05_09675 [Candidatus Acidoferrales bacterium]|nr:hypothetical protein [Candidatus Acidoferrales bacterium]
MLTKRRGKHHLNGQRPGFHSRKGTAPVSLRDSNPILDRAATEAILRPRVFAPHLYEAKLLLGDMFREPFESATSIATRIDEVIADDDLYELGEPRPSSETVAKAKELILSAEYVGSKFPHPKISVYFGEVDITWKAQDRLLRVIVFPDPLRPAALYFQTDKGEALTRGESVEVTNAEDLSRSLNWLLG